MQNKPGSLFLENRIKAENEKYAKEYLSAKLSKIRGWVDNKFEIYDKEAQTTDTFEIKIEKGDDGEKWALYLNGNLEERFYNKKNALPYISKYY